MIPWCWCVLTSIVHVLVSEIRFSASRRRRINSEMKLTAHVKLAALLAAAAAETGIVDGPYPIMYGEM